MCLAVRYDKVCKRRTGYKLVKRDGRGRLRTGQTGHANPVTLTKGKYTTDPSKGTIQLGGCSGSTYPTGFHIFPDRKSAERVQRYDSHRLSLVLCKVRFKDVVAYGEVSWHFNYGKYNFHATAVVARKCMITEVIS